MNEIMTSPEIMSAVTANKAKVGVHTQYVVKVVKVSENGRFVDVIHCTLEWQAGIDGESIMLNELGFPVLASPTKPWIINDVPVEQPYLRGQWKLNARPRVGDYGVLSVFYHDIESWKRNGGFQAPEAIRIHALDSCSFRPGLPNHADVGAEEEGSYPTDDKMEIKGNGVSLSLSSSNNEEAKVDNLVEIKSGADVNISLKTPGYEDSESDKEVLVKVGSISISIKVPHEGDPVMDINCPTLNITGDVNVTGTVTADTDVIGGGVSLKNHTHDFPYSAGDTPTTGTTEVPTPQE